MSRSSRRETTAAAEAVRDRRARRRIAYLDASARLLVALYPYARAILILGALRDQGPHLLRPLLGS
jgi:hypothetical protein